MCRIITNQLFVFSESYDEGLKKLERLKFEESVLTLESEDSTSDVQQQLTMAIKRQKLMSQANKLKVQFTQSTQNADITEPDSMKGKENHFVYIVIYIYLFICLLFLDQLIQEPKQVDKRNGDKTTGKQARTQSSTAFDKTEKDLPTKMTSTPKKLLTSRKKEPEHNQDSLDETGSIKLSVSES